MLPARLSRDFRPNMLVACLFCFSSLSAVLWLCVLFYCFGVNRSIPLCQNEILYSALKKNLNKEYVWLKMPVIFFILNIISSSNFVYLCCSKTVSWLNMGAFWWYVAVVHTVLANMKYLYLYTFETEMIKMT